jgi:hypothetical protein
MKITLSTTAQDFSYILQKYEIYEPTFIQAKPDGDIEFTLDLPYNLEGVMKCVFLIGQGSMIEQILKTTLNYEKPIEDNSIYSFLEKA